MAKGAAVPVDVGLTWTNCQTKLLHLHLARSCWASRTRLVLSTHTHFRMCQHMCSLTHANACTRRKRANAFRLAPSSNPRWSCFSLLLSFLFLFLSPGCSLRGPSSSERQGEQGAYISKANVATLDSQHAPAH